MMPSEAGAERRLWVEYVPVADHPPAVATNISSGESGHPTVQGHTSELPGRCLGESQLSS